MEFGNLFFFSEQIELPAGRQAIGGHRAKFYRAGDRRRPWRLRQAIHGRQPQANSTEFKNSRIIEQGDGWFVECISNDCLPF